jgi:hypothetical protein
MSGNIKSDKQTKALKSEALSKEQIRKIEESLKGKILFKDKLAEARKTLNRVKSLPI